MKDKVKYIFIGIIIIGCFLLGHQCGSKSVKIPIYKNNSIFIHDTIYPDTTKIEIPKPYPVYDTVYITEGKDIPKDSIEFKNIFKVRKYEKSYKDNNIQALITSEVLGYMLKQNIEYKDFKPISIVNSTVTTFTRLDTLKVPIKWELRGTIEGSIKNTFVGLEYQKNRITYGAAYDPFNKQIKAKLGFTIFRK